MDRTASDQLIARLVEGGVHRVYGYPGDGINGVMGALRRAQDTCRTTCRSWPRSSRRC